MQLSSTLNPRPALLAALLTEEGQSADQIGIHPVDGHPGVSLREVLELKRERKTGATIIVAHTKSEARMNIERDLDEQHPLRTLTTIFEREMTYFQITAALRERAHLLGLSPMQPAFFPETRAWDETQGKILSFFLPYRSQIRGDMVLTGKCLSAALGLPVYIEPTRSATLHHPGATVDACISDAECIAGGKVLSCTPRVKVNIGLVLAERLPDFIPGAIERRFLEEALLPQLLPEGCEWEINIRVDPQYAVFRVATPEIPLYTDINSIIA